MSLNDSISVLLTKPETELPTDSRICFDTQSLSLIFASHTDRLGTVSLRGRLFGGESPVFALYKLELGGERRPVDALSFNADLNLICLRAEDCFVERLGLGRAETGEAVAEMRRVGEAKRRVRGSAFHPRNPAMLFVLFEGNAVECYDTLRDLDEPFFYVKLPFDEKVKGISFAAGAGDAVSFDELCLFAETGDNALIAFGPVLVPGFALADALFNQIETVEARLAAEDFGRCERVAALGRELRRLRPSLAKGLEAAAAGLNERGHGQSATVLSAEPSAHLCFTHVRPLAGLGSLVVCGRMSPESTSKGGFDLAKLELQFLFAMDCAFWQRERPIELSRFEFFFSVSAKPRFAVSTSAEPFLFVLAGAALTRIPLKFLDLLSEPSADLRRRVESALRSETITLRLEGFTGIELAVGGASAAFVLARGDSLRGTTLLLADFSPKAAPALAAVEARAEHIPRFGRFDSACWDALVEGWRAASAEVARLADARDETAAPALIAAFDECCAVEAELEREANRVAADQSRESAYYAEQARLAAESQAQLAEGERRLCAMAEARAGADAALRRRINALLDQPERAAAPETAQLQRELAALQLRCQTGEFEAELQRLREIAERLCAFVAKSEVRAAARQIAETAELREKLARCAGEVQKLEQTVREVRARGQNDLI